MRNTDDLQSSEPWRPLGERVTRAPAPPAPAPAPQPRGPYGIVEDADGRLKTTTQPKG